MSKTVLLVDDDPEFLSALSPLLNTAGYSVITAKDAKEARSVLDDHRVFIDAAIIDLELPEIGGFHIIGELARAQKRPIPIMAITAAYSDVHLEVAEYLGAKISVRKPKPGRPLTLLVDGLKVLISESPAA
jgi:DNA-binding response OmpR family regulator